MKIPLTAIALSAVLLTSCGDSSERTTTETTVTETETEYSTTRQNEIDDTAFEIEQASHEVDSLLNDL